MHAERWFILPPVQEHFYRARNLSYRPLPPWGTACSASAHRRPMNLIYPAPHARIVIPRDFDGKPAGSVFELAHQEKDAEVFWHLDGTFIGVTKGIHQISINPDQGSHVLTLVDRNGFSLKQEFEVISTP